MKLGLVGWRGMVGSVLMQRMHAENDFDNLDVYFFSTSNAGGIAPSPSAHPLLDAFDISKLAQCDVIMSCQGGDYTQKVHAPLRQSGWAGYWIDAASTLRMDDQAMIVLDPVNGALIDQALRHGVRDYIGGNCTVSLMLLALHGLFKLGCIEYIHAATYQAASGAGAQNMRELLAQMGSIYTSCQNDLNDPASAILTIDQAVLQQQKSSTFPIQQFGAALAGSLIPWIDADLGNGQSKEERKGDLETNKILGLSAHDANQKIQVESMCVRIGTMRSHAQCLTVYLNQKMPMDAIIEHIQHANPWVRYIPNEKTATLAQLNPVACSGNLDILVGRVRELTLPKSYRQDGMVIDLFTVGDQLLWGAAEPLRRMLALIIKYENIGSKNQDQDAS